MKIEEARIASHVCGDGWLSAYVEKNSLQIVHGRKYRRNRKRYTIGYSNTQKILLDQFEGDMKKAFGINARRTKGQLLFRSKRVFERLKELGSGDSRNWFIGSDIMAGSDDIKREWLKAFFDDEATVDIITKRVRIKSINERGLTQACRLVKQFGIETSLTGPNVDNSWYMTISKGDFILFYERIGFYHKERQNKLKELVLSLK